MRAKDEDRLTDEELLAQVKLVPATGPPHVMDTHSHAARSSSPAQKVHQLSFVASFINSPFTRRRRLGYVPKSWKRVRTWIMRL